jgi:acetyltransferase-like isoleucine patch superfamily enzyme
MTSSRFRRIVELLRGREPDLSAARLRQFELLASIGPGVVFYPEAELANAGAREQVQIGENCHIAGQLSALAGGSRLRLGAFCFVGKGSRIWAQDAVEIGNHVMISHLVDIHDTNSHSFNRNQRRAELVARFSQGREKDWSEVECRPILIEDDVWIGYKSSILKGVRIGSGAVVGAGSVVTKDVPANAVVAGNPARIIRA